MPTFWMYVQAPLKRLGIAPGTRQLRRGQSAPLQALQPWPVAA
jgi:hypothetical protein